jgi:hypothetical protein
MVAWALVAMTAFAVLPALAQQDEGPILMPKKPANSAVGTTPSRSPALLHFTGTYSGRVHNLTGGVSADFTVSVRESENGAIEGCMAVKPPLGGSGYLKGSVQGSEISFDVVGALSEIAFSGKQLEKKLNGTYLVTFPNGPKENGEFTLSRTSSVAPRTDFSSQSCPNDLAILTPLAEQGDAGAQAYLGTMYYLGKGVMQDYAHAANLIHRAAQQGNVSAQFMLGVFYLQGIGVSLDYSEAYFWCKIASVGRVEGVTKETIASLLNKISSQLSSEAQEKVDKRTRDWFAEHTPTPK